MQLKPWGEPLREMGSGLYGVRQPAGAASRLLHCIDISGRGSRHSVCPVPPSWSWNSFLIDMIEGASPNHICTIPRTPPRYRYRGECQTRAPLPFTSTSTSCRASPALHEMALELRGKRRPDPNPLLVVLEGDGTCERRWTRGSGNLMPRLTGLSPSFFPNAVSHRH